MLNCHHAMYPTHVQSNLQARRLHFKAVMSRTLLYKLKRIYMAVVGTLKEGAAQLEYTGRFVLAPQRPPEVLL